MDIQVLKWLYKKSKFCLVKVMVLTVGDFIFAVTTLLFALFSRGIIDSAIELNRSRITWYGIGLLAIIVLQLVMRLILNSMQEITRSKLSNQYRGEVLRTVLGKEYENLTHFHSGEILNRMFSDVQIIADGVTTLVPSIVNLVTKLIGAIVILFFLDSSFAFIFLFLGTSFFVIALFFRGNLKHLHRNVQEKEGKVRSFLQESVEALLIIKVFGSEKKIMKQNDERQNNLFDAQMKRKDFSVMTNAGFFFVFQTIYLLALVWGTRGLYLQMMTFGTFTAIIQIIGQVQTPLAVLSGILPKLYGIIASSERLIELEKLPDEVQEKNYEKSEKFIGIEFNQVYFSYGRTPILTDVSYRINRGDFVVITGLSGVGKSTQFYLMLGAYHVQNGSVQILSDCGKQNPGRNSRYLFAYVPQGNYLFAGTVRDNIAFINENATDEEIKVAAKLACADSFIEQMPDGYQTTLGEKGFGLSEGQAQRIAIARALLSDSQVLLLDEATSALDEKTEEELLKNIAGIKNKTCIIVTHRKAALEVCNKQILVNDTEVIMRELS